MIDIDVELGLLTEVEVEEAEEDKYLRKLSDLEVVFLLEKYIGRYGTYVVDFKRELGKGIALSIKFTGDIFDPDREELFLTDYFCEVYSYEDYEWFKLPGEYLWDYRAGMLEKFGEEYSRDFLLGV